MLERVLFIKIQQRLDISEFQYVLFANFNDNLRYNISLVVGDGCLYSIVMHRVEHLSLLKEENSTQFNRRLEEHATILHQMRLYKSPGKSSMSTLLCSDSLIAKNSFFVFIRRRCTVQCAADTGLRMFIVSQVCDS